MLHRHLGLRGFVFVALAFMFVAPHAHAQSDSCSTATPIAPGAYSGTTAGASVDGGASCGVSDASPDVWYRYTPASACLLRVNTCPSSYDSVLSIHSACPGSAANELACNDDVCALASVVEYPAAAGATYYIRVSGYNGQSGSFTLNVLCNPPVERDDCTLATAVKSGSYSGVTTGASNDGAASCGQSAAAPDVWFRYTPDSSCVLTADTCGSSYDTVLSIHTGCPGSPSNELVCNDDTCGLGSAVSTGAQAGVDYLIRVSGFAGAVGSFNLNIGCEPLPQSDSCADAVDIGVGTRLFDTSIATVDGSAGCDHGADSPDVWFRYSPLESCTVQLNTCNSSLNTVVSIHVACPGISGNQIACSDDDCGLQSFLSASLNAGEIYYIRVAGTSGDIGAGLLSLSCSPGLPVGADIYCGELTEIATLGRLNDITGVAIDSPLCNAGSVPLDWIANPDPRHPFMIFNMYRLSSGGGRIEQIGQSWAKHAQGAAQADACGFGCTPYPDHTHLGVGCSDTYGASYNGNQANLGPRSEINPFTGAYNFFTSHLSDPNAPPHTPVSHLLQLRDADLNPATNPGATYVCETYILGHDDENHLNSLAHEPVHINGSPGGTWAFDIANDAGSNGPAILAWPGATRTVFPAQPNVFDGRAILGAKATPNADGTWHYEYALYNHDMALAIGYFSVPLGNLQPSNVGFHAVASHDEARFDNVPWEHVVTPDGLLYWATRSYAGPSSNPLRWGTLYNFWFDCDAPPVERSVRILPFFPGGASLFTVDTIAPSTCRADYDADGLVNTADLFLFLADFFNDNADFNMDGGTDSQDFFDFLGEFFQGCPR